MKRLTNAQRGMLKWIAECGPNGYRPNCDDRQPPSNKLKDAAWALSKKGMVKFEERGPRFRLTDKGRIMLQVMEA